MRRLGRIARRKRPRSARSVVRPPPHAALTLLRISDAPFVQGARRRSGLAPWASIGGLDAAAPPHPASRS